MREKFDLAASRPTSRPADADPRGYFHSAWCCLPRACSRALCKRPPTSVDEGQDAGPVGGCRVARVAVGSGAAGLRRVNLQAFLLGKGAAGQVSSASRSNASARPPGPDPRKVHRLETGERAFALPTFKGPSLTGLALSALLSSALTEHLLEEIQVAALLRNAWHWHPLRCISSSLHRPQSLCRIPSFLMRIENTRR